ncbi:hypothetical protein AKO1_013951 [Acrasis kona]|uniref:Uncharacterized protein n=1 Tax=Acrasis kona TaxID=1008807 RepID=A0AAW2Z455_9EUKA
MGILRNLFIAEGLLMNVGTGAFAILATKMFVEQLSPDQIVNQVNKNGELIHIMTGMFGLCMIILGILEAIIFSLATPRIQKIAAAFLFFGDFMHGAWIYNTYSPYPGNMKQVLSNVIPMASVMILRVSFLLSSQSDVKIKNK